MSVLDKDINITLGTVGDQCTSISPRINEKLSSFQLRRIFGGPMYDSYQLERHGIYREVCYDALRRLAHQKLIDVFTEMLVEQMTGPAMIAELEMHDIKIDGIAITNFASTWKDDPRATTRSILTFELYALNGRGQYKKVAQVAIDDHWANANLWAGVARIWMQYPRNGGQFHGKGKWGRHIYQAPKRDQLSAYIP